MAAFIRQLVKAFRGGVSLLPTEPAGKIVILKTFKKTSKRILKKVLTK